MSPADDKSTSNTPHAVALRMRPDLSIEPQQMGRRRYWVVKDPVALTYFQLREEEHAILRMLDGRTSLGEIKRRFEQAFAPLQMTVEQLQAFLGRLYRCGLLLSEASGQGEQLLLGHRRHRLQTLRQSFSNVLAIRFRGINAEPLLQWLYPRCRWIFSHTILAGCLLLVLAAATLLTVQFDVLQSKLPDFYTLFSVDNALWLAIALAMTKILHEFGHALTCKHFDGECHELGVMLLAFTPCLYCDVSDSWMLAAKWRRIAVSAAGMGVEIVLASLCTFLWWFSEPGLLNVLCLNTMLVCSVSTVLFNGNPLLRYDGYYILSDLVEVPNLAQQSKALVDRALSRVFLGVKTSNDRALPERHRGLLAAYAVASTVYRWFVVIAILWYCSSVLTRYNLEAVADVLVLTVVAGMLAPPLWNAVRGFRNPAWRRQFNSRRAAIGWSVLVAVAIAVCSIPLPFHVAAPVVLKLQDERRVYVSTPGTLGACVAPGVKVKQGHTLARLDDLGLRLQVAELECKRNQQRLHCKNLELRSVLDPRAGSEIPTAREALIDVEKRLREQQGELQRLFLKAPAAGTVLPPPATPLQPYMPDRLKAYHGSPFDDHNRGQFLKTGALFCLIGDPSRLEAVLVIDQSDVKFVRTGQRVRVQLDELPGEVILGTIREIAKNDLKVAPRELAAGAELPTRVDEFGVPRPLETSYQAHVTLDGVDHELLTGACGRAKILADPQSLGRRLYRYLSRTFNFGL